MAKLLEKKDFYNRLKLWNVKLNLLKEKFRGKKGSEQMFNRKIGGNF